MCLCLSDISGISYNYRWLFLTAIADAIRTSLGPKGMDKMVGLGDLSFSVQPNNVVNDYVHCLGFCPHVALVMCLKKAR